MHYKSEDEFAKVFKELTPAGCYFLYGNEGYLVDTWAKKILDKVQKTTTNEIFKVSGTRTDYDMLYNQVETVSFMGGDKCVLLSDLVTTKLPAEDMDKLFAIISDLPQGCVLVITAKTGFDSSTAISKKLIKLASEKGCALELAKRGQSGLITFIKSICKKNKCEISTAVAHFILQTVDTDMNTLKCELEKICGYANGAEITQQHVLAVGIAKTEVKVFDLSKMILAGNAQRSLEILADLYELREHPLAIMATLNMAFIDLYRARVARDEGKDSAEVTKLFAYKSAYRVSNAFSSKKNIAYLRSSIDILINCDKKMKSTGINPELLLEQAVIELLGTA